MSNLFDSVFTTTSSNINPLLLLLALGVSLVLGIALSYVYRYRTIYTREFATTLILLPSLMSLMIFLVNGSLGTSIAVAGTFSLIRFRSATSGSRELLAIFLSMIIGLAVGSGFIVLAITFTLAILGIWLIIDSQQATVTQQTSRHLTVTYYPIAANPSVIEQVLHQYCDYIQFISLKSRQSGQEMTLSYEVNLKRDISDGELLESLQTTIQPENISLSTKAKKKKNL